MSHQDHTAPVPYSQIPDFSGYRFYHDGTLTTRWLSGKGRQWVLTDDWMPLIRPVNPSLGYTLISFRTDSGATTYIAAHIMCALAFFGPCPEGKEVCHRDDVKANNTIGNIYYGTRAENVADALRNGRMLIGEKNGQSILTESDVREIRSRPRKWGYQTRMAAEFGVTVGCINGILKRRLWKHVP